MPATNIDQLRQLIHANMDLILAFLADDHDKAIQYLVSYSNSQGIQVTAAEISNAIKAKAGRLSALGGSGTSGHAILLGHYASSAHTTPM